VCVCGCCCQLAYYCLGSAVLRPMVVLTLLQFWRSVSLCALCQRRVMMCFGHSMRHAPVSVVACWLRVYIGVCRPHGFALHVAYPSSRDVLAVLPPVHLELFPVLFWVSGGGLISCARWTLVTSGLVHNGWTRSPGDVMQPHGDTSTGKEKEVDCKSCNPSQPLMIHAVCVNAFYLPVLPPTS
jgi:hypothetical protein